MKVTVNRTTVDLFEGARVQDAVLRYCVRRKIKPALARTASVFDAYGHQIGLDAPLHEGQTIKCKIAE